MGLLFEELFGDATKHAELGSGNGYGRNPNKAMAVKVKLFRRAHVFVNPLSLGARYNQLVGQVTPIGMAQL